MGENKLNLKNDIIFKNFFARKGNEEFLIDFLNGLLGIEIAKIDIREEVNLEQLSVKEKGGRLDLQATLNDGIIVSIELQIQDRYNVLERTRIYESKVISRNVERGTDYQFSKKTIMVNILGYNIFEEVEDYISKVVKVLDKHREYEVKDGSEWWFIELPKFRKSNPNMDEKINQWLAFIDDENRRWVEMAEEKNVVIKKAKKEMSYLTGDEEVRRLAELREKWDEEYEASMRYAREKGEKAGMEIGLREGKEKGMEQGMQKGIQQGIEKGIQQGIEEGIQQGIRQGKQEGIKEANIENAKVMKKLNIPIEQIMEITKLTKEEIEKIK